MPEESESVEQPRARKPSRRRASKRGPRSRLLALLAEAFPKFTQVLHIAMDWTRRKPLWVRVPLYAAIGIGGLVYVFSDSVMKLPVVQDVRDTAAGYVEGVFAVPLPKASGRAFAIGVVRIEDDDTGDVAKSLIAALKIEGVERLQINRRLRFVDSAEPDAAETAAHEKARRWLGRCDADLMIWGQVLKGDKPPAVRIIFTPRHAPVGGEARASTSHLSFTLVEQVEGELEAAVRAQALAVLGQFAPTHAVAGPLTQAIARLEKVVQSREDGPGKAAVVFALANARVTLGEQTGRAADLDRAIGTYEGLLTDRLRQSAPNDWAMIQNMLGIASWIRGKAARDPERLDAAERAYRRALEVYGGPKPSREWAFAQNGLGLALESRAALEAGTERLVAAAEAYRAGSTAFAPATAPADWAMLQNNLGNVLVALGEREAAPEKVREAVALFRAAAGVKVRDQAPLSWAMTQNNLGVALVALGELESQPRHFEDAVQACRAALAEYPEARVPLDWAMAQNNLGTALARLGERESGPARLAEAAAAFRAALGKRSRERQPVRWALTQANLANVLLLLARRENLAAQYREALDAYREARDALRAAKAPLEFAQVSEALGTALREDGVRNGSVAQIDDAVGIYHEALAVPEVQRLRPVRNRLQNALWQAEAAKAELLEATSRPTPAGPR